MKKKVLITGGKGMLATALEAYYLAAGADVKAPTHAELDVLDRTAVAEAVAAFKPAYVFYTACLHVDASENDPESAYKLNSWASAQMAMACAKQKSELVYISSCGYFGDEVKPYSEYDPVVLKTVYARSKYEGEVLAMRENPKTYAIRPGWLFGGSVKHKKNFVYQRYLEAQKTPVLKSAGDKFGTPTLVDDLVAKIDEIIKTEVVGLYHVTNSGGGSRADYVKKIVESCGLKTAVEAVDSSAFPRKANVPNCEILHNWNLKYLGLKSLPSWEEAIDRYVGAMFKELGK
ncbi:MAG: NAD(P)-dependent oxidoreductase [Candidatus Margulisbacteria bacterium]|nr:NAD(P)-dependent oxidoreductase [Candidatus Margulisiibacteriota bacterium]MBU1617353.1 NAD(P)-dependent oxidoreductase [Candidatus Margulisiibacteriota bacterium]